MPRNFLFVGFKAQFFRQRLSCSEKVGSDSQPVPLDLNAQRGKRRREHVHRRKHTFLSLHRRCRRIEKAVIHAAMAVSAQLLHGLYFDMGSGELLYFDAESETYVPMVNACASGTSSVKRR